MIFHPKIFDSLQSYQWSDFTRDLMAGIVVGIVALPLAIAFGIASGVTPQQGIITAIVAGFLISLLGGSRVQIGGPTGAFIVIIYGVIAEYGLDGLLIATFMAGILLIVMGLCKLGNWITFVPTSVIVGFTSGIALVIFSTQIPSVLGLRIESIPADFLHKWLTYLEFLPQVSWQALFITAITILVIAICQKKFPRIPGAFIALLLTTTLAQLFHFSLDTVGSRFGEINFQLPDLGLPTMDFAKIKSLVPPALAIAALGAIESLLSAVVADGMIGGRHRSNTELIAQGVANMVSPLFGGIAATGAIARTALNVKTGGRTPIAGMTHAITLLMLVFFFGQYTAMIPMATLGGILLVVAYNMSEWRHFKRLFKSPKADVSVLLATFFLTVFIDLVVAIQVGMLLSTFLFMAKMAKFSEIHRSASSSSSQQTPTNLLPLKIPANVTIFEVKGAFFFGAASKFETILLQDIVRNNTIILRFHQLHLLDATGIQVLQRTINTIRAHNSRLMLAEVDPRCMHTLIKSDLVSEIGMQNIHSTLEQALTKIEQENLARAV